MKIIRKLVLTLGVTLFFFALVEFGAWVYVASQPNIYQGDVGYFWSLRPSIDQQIEQDEYHFRLRTNSLGLRDDDLSIEKERWLFLGCSTTLGWGVEREKGFVALLDQHFPNIDIVNGGQPGWTTQQGLMGIEIFRSIQPQKVFLGFGVRDAQFSYREDREARPTPWIFSLNLVQLLTKLKSKKEQQGEKRRVPAQHFERNIKLLRKAFPQAEVYLYSFPKLEREEEYEKVIRRLGGAVATGFHGADFFTKDTIHLNELGHQKLADWFISEQRANLVPESKKRPSGKIE